MAKKTLKKKVSGKSASKKAVKPAVDSAREIWLAGLGAFNVAQQESGRIIEQGSKLFEKLVAEGSKAEVKTRKDVESAVGSLRGEVENRMGTMKQQADVVRKQATDNWDKLEKIFENRVARALAGLGIPSKDDVADLADKVQNLAQKLADLADRKIAPGVKANTPAKTVVSGSKPAKKPVVPKVAKKPVARKAAKKKAVAKAPK